MEQQRSAVASAPAEGPAAATTSTAGSSQPGFVPTAYQMFVERRESEVTPRKRRTWAATDLAVMDYLVAAGVSPRVLSVRKFLRAHVELKITKSEPAIVLKMSDVMKEINAKK